MTKVAILPEPSGSGTFTFRAVAGTRQSVGKTAGEALDALNKALPPEDSGTLVVVQNFRPDSLFTVAQQERLRELMARWRQARDSGNCLPSSEQAELDDLVAVEVRAASKRAAEMLRAAEE